MVNDYSSITELPNTMVTNIQLKRAHQRYVFASKHCDGKVVLEIGCGGGQGLEILSAKAKKVIGCDIDDSNIELCRATYKDRPAIEILKMNANNLEFQDRSVDVIVLFETIYYLKEVTKFFLEANRILSKDGRLIICTTNKDWPNFNPSPFSTQYFSVMELCQLSLANGFNIDMYASFPDIQINLLSKLISFIKRVAVKHHFMPKTMKGKVLLKKIFQGKMVTYPKILNKDLFDYESPIIIPTDKNDTIHTAIFAVCRKV
jgi:ubiquinone/menaquinone biosynthesis C-methylase UbiE